MINLFITFLIGGIWHGAAWTFVLWGGLHGLALVIERIFEKIGLKLNKWLSLPLTFLFANAAWVFFRATNFNDAFKVLKAMVNPDFNLPELIKDSSGYLWLITAAILAFFGKNSNEYLEKFKPNAFNFLLAFVLIIIAILHLNQLSEFIYFQF